MSDLDIKLTLADIERHRQKHGARKTKHALSILGKKSKFMEAIKTPIGQELLKDMMFRMEVLLEKNLKLEISKEERIEYEILNKLSDSWIGRIYSYLQSANKLTED